MAPVFPSFQEQQQRASLHQVKLSGLAFNLFLFVTGLKASRADLCLNALMCLVTAHASVQGAVLKLFLGLSLLDLC